MPTRTILSSLRRSALDILDVEQNFIGAPYGIRRDDEEMPVKAEEVKHPMPTRLIPPTCTTAQPISALFGHTSSGCGDYTRASTFRTDDAYHRPPRGVVIPRAFKASAI